MSATVTATVSRSNLQRANEVRRTRGRMRRHLHALPRVEGRLAVAALLLTTPEWVQSVQVGELLTWPSRTYRREIAQWLAAAEVTDERARVAGAFRRDNSNQNPRVLTERQRHILAACLRGDQPDPWR